MTRAKLLFSALALCLVAAVSGCGGESGGGDTPPIGDRTPTPEYTDP